MNRLRAVFSIIGFYFSLLFVGTMMLGVCILAALLNPLLSARLATSLGRWMIHTVFRIFLVFLQTAGLVRLDLSALDNLRDEKNLIIAPNHPSMLDVLLIISHLNNTSCIMKAQLLDNIFLGAGARMARYVRNDSINSMIRLAADDLKRGGKLLIFPEGTRTIIHPINPLKGGIGLIARRANVPIQTVILQSNSQYLSKGWPLFKRPALPLIYQARLGKRFEPQADVTALVREIENYYLAVLTHLPALDSTADDSSPVNKTAHY